MRTSLATFLSLLFATGCLERFEPEVTSVASLLVVEGHISDLNEPNTIRLSRSRAVRSTAFVPETGAVVAVLDGSGRSYMFGEVKPGVYQNPASDLRGSVGESYTLDIVTTAGSHYQSEPVAFKQTPPINDVYHEADSRLTEDRTVLSGIAIFLDAFDSSRSTSYYRWEFIENWEIQVPIPSKFDFKLNADSSGMGYPIPKQVPVDICYSSDTSSRVLVASTKLLTEDRVTKYEVNFVSTQGFKLKSFYGVIVRQYALDETAFEYWDQLRAASESLGTLFDPQPYQLTGNVFNVDNIDEPVLGYFDASSVSMNSLVLDREQLERDSLIYPLEQCLLERDTVPFRLVPDFLQSGYLIDTLGPFGETYLIMAPTDCSDCRLYGTLERPKFRPE